MTNQSELTQGIARILDDSILDAYNESIKSYNERARESLGKFGRSNGELTGSSPLMIIQLINSGLLPERTRLATRDDLEYTISKDDFFLRGKYTVFGLALRRAGDSYEPNDLLAKRLATQLEQRNINLDRGKLIPLDVLSLREDENSAYGVVTDLKKEAESSIRDSIRELSDFEWDYTRDEGLSCANLYRYRDWGSDYEHLAISGGYGRVVVVSGEATTKNSQQDDLIKKVQSALNAKKSFEYKGTLYVPVSDKGLKIR